MSDAEKTEAVKTADAGPTVDSTGGLLRSVTRFEQGMMDRCIN
jgi:hypothetical protein